MNKSIILSLILALNVISLSAVTKFDEPVTKNGLYKKMFHLNPLALTIGGFEMGFERPTTKKESFYVNAGYYLSAEAGALDLKDDYSNMSGFRIEAQYRFYRKPNNYIRNVYLAPFANFKTVSAEHINYTYNNLPPYTSTQVVQKYSATTVSFGYMLGMRRSVFENIYMDLGIGGGIFLPVSGDYHNELNIPLFSPYQKGVQFKASFGFSIAL
jgi:hypothetical protein